MGKYGKAIIVGFAVAFVISAFFGFLGQASGAGFGFSGLLIGVVFGGITAYLLANLTGTKAGPAASEEVKRAALSPTVTAGRARVIVLRQGFVAMAAGLNISIDGRPVAQIKSPQWTAVELPAGAHSLQAAFTGLAGAQSKASETAFEVRDGEIAVFRLTIGMGAIKNSVRIERIPMDESLSAQLANQKMVAPAA